MPDTPYQNTYCITRVNGANPSGTPVHLWVVNVKRYRKLYVRNFADSVYGGKEAAWQMAVAYRDALLRLFPPYTLLEQQTQPRANNKSGIAGVSARHIKGKRTAWIATLEASGVTYNCYFSIKEHGEEKAKALAIAARQELLAQHPNRFVTTNAGATQMAQALFQPMLQGPHDSNGMASQNRADQEAMPNEQRRLELLNAWFDAVRPQFIQLRLSVYFLSNKGYDSLFIVVGDGSPSGHKQHKSWTIQRRTYQEVLQHAWDYAQAILTQQFGRSCWREFAKSHQATVLASTPEQPIFIRHRCELPGHAVLRKTPPVGLQHMLRGFRIPALVSSGHFSLRCSKSIDT
ncbi:AP2 domain-containing protein [Diaphorobacter sp. HDW4A]|uniref:AP2/ERF family transcription factor n=1 Tax=Diaphorobacter sp. HDW4A TaxID=2714924 RepID=UPI00140985A3|nr:AP2/ERF family transcription factor [Diaphorobacter sp. HDW4A]QIL80765.1 AP2 domain-containing protein [Diaphorobacter sp. HDW4A]